MSGPEMDGGGSALCPVAGFVITGVEPLGFATHYYLEIIKYLAVRYLSAFISIFIIRG
jgi:hypothetical protein